MQESACIIPPFISFPFFHCSALALALHRRIMASGRLFAINGRDGCICGVYHAAFTWISGGDAGAEATGLEKLGSLISCNVHTSHDRATLNIFLKFPCFSSFSRDSRLARKALGCTAGESSYVGSARYAPQISAPGHCQVSKTRAHAHGQR